MDKKIEKILEDDERKYGWDKWRNNDELLEQLRESDEVYKELIDEHRWWNEYRYTIKVEDTYIGYVYAETTGDMNASETGYDFDPDSICEMTPVEKTITTYVKKEENNNVK